MGSRGAQAEAVTNFLKYNTSEYLYLVGDIIDFWALKRKVFFPESHTTVLRKIFKRAANGTKVFYTPGNHDEAVRQFIPLSFGEVQIDDEFVHTTEAGKRLLIIHGDCYDQVVKYARWLAFAGDIGYSFLLRCNGFVNRVRKWFGYGYWSMSKYIKQRVKTAVSFVGEYENAVVHSVIDRGLDGVVCGHIHCAELRDMNGIIYANSGDWVESLTALVEHMDGRLELIHWVTPPE